MNYDIPLTTLGGDSASLSDYRGKAILVVNVASRCGKTPQYQGLEALQVRYSKRGFCVLGFPCNQFGGQEPGTPEEIQQFCSTRDSVTFPLFAKLDVKGPNRHPLYAQLTGVADAAGEAGDVRWNFEKFLVSGTGQVSRFRSGIEPDDSALIEAIEAALPA